MNTEAPVLPEKRIYPSVQLLRGIAALLVAAHHVSPHIQDLRPADLLYKAFYMGVDIFFVISGFVMMSVHHDDLGVPKRAANFALRRFIRIFPPYWAVLFLAVIFNPYLFDGVQSPVTAFLSSIFLMPRSFMFGIPSWTLTYELYFYLLFAIGILLPRRISLIPAYIVMGVSLILSVAVLTGHAGIVGSDNRAGYRPETYISYFFGPHILEFAAGCLVAYAIRRNVIRYHNILLYAGLMLLFAVLPYGVSIRQAPPPGEELFPCRQVAMFLPPFAFILYGLAVKDIKKEITVPRLMLFLGNASYSVYLTHQLIRPLVLDLLKSVLPLPSAFRDYLILFATGMLTRDYLILLAAALMAIPGCVFYLCVEKPLLRVMKKGLRDRRPQVAERNFQPAGLPTDVSAVEPEPLPKA